MRITPYALFIFASSTLCATDMEQRRQGLHLQDKLYGVDIKPEMSVDELSYALEPIMKNYGYQKWVTQRTKSALKNMGIDEKIIAAFIRRRRQERYNKMQEGYRNGEEIERYRSLNPKPSRVYLTGQSRRRISDETIFAQAAELEVIETRMRGIGLSHLSDPEEIADHYDFLRGKLSKNNFGRVMGAFIKKYKKDAHWAKGYELAMRRKRDSKWRQSLTGIYGRGWRRNKETSRLRKLKEAASQHGESSSSDDLVEEMRGEAVNVEASVQVTHQDHVGAIASYGHLSRPIHHFRLPNTWYRPALNSAQHNEQGQHMHFQEDKNSDDSNVADYTIPESDEELVPSEEESHEERPTVGIKSYKGRTRPSTASLTLSSGTHADYSLSDETLYHHEPSSSHMADLRM